jgi:hypothetical protein
MGRSRRRNRHREAARRGIPDSQLRNREPNRPSVAAGISADRGQVMVPEEIQLDGPISRQAPREEIHAAVVRQVALHYGVPEDEIKRDFIFRPPLFDAGMLVFKYAGWSISITGGQTTVGDLIDQLVNE